MIEAILQTLLKTIAMDKRAKANAQKGGDGP